MKNSLLTISLLIFQKRHLSFNNLLIMIPLMASASAGKVPSVGPVRVEFIIFGLILLGVALLHKQTFWVAVIGLTVLLDFQIRF